MATKNIFNVRPFNLHTLKPHTNIVIVGPRRRGKTTVMYDIMEVISQRIDFAMAMAGSVGAYEGMLEHMDPAFVYEDVSNERVASFVEAAKTLRRNKKERHLLLAWDDCMYNKNALKTKEMRFIHMNGRHARITFINCVQYLMDMPADCRAQIDYVFALQEPVKVQREKLHKYFFGVFERYNDFAAVFNACTANRECLVLDNTQTSNVAQDRIFYFKARFPSPEFHIGKPVYRAMANVCRSLAPADTVTHVDEDRREAIATNITGVSKMMV